MITRININDFVSEVPRSIANEALYYCLRALKQSALPSASKKDYFYDTNRSKPSEEAVALAQRILNEISSAENSDLDRISRSRIHEYITLIARAIEQISESDPSLDLRKGAELLRRMREP